MTLIEISLVEWSRWQFALTAMYHWLFVPLTLGLSFIIAFMETLYYKTGNEEWKKITKFWMTLFGINFAIGIATGIILEFQFGTNWSNYSWFVGDIFGAPLAIEGIMAFFMESTFIAVMFFGWNKVSKKFHLISTWLVAIGSNLSALWILVANAWMQNPVGMKFNPDTARNEMFNFWEVLLSPMAVNKFLHTVSSGYVLASIFVIGISSWFILKNRNELIAKRSIVIAAVFGLISAIFLATTGDGSAYYIAKKQPMKLAAFEGLYKGEKSAGLVAFGIHNPNKKWNDINDAFLFEIKIPGLLSILANRNKESYVPGIKDYIEGNENEGIISLNQKIERGRLAISALSQYKQAKKKNDTLRITETEIILKDNFQYFGYGYLHKAEDIIPNVPLVFYSFHIMVILGFFFILFFILFLYLILNKHSINKWILRTAIFTIPLAYLASMSGWTVAEVGRQPWVIQDLMPTVAAVSNIDANAVVITFWLFAALFTSLLIAEISIMIKQIKIGPTEH